MTAGHLDLPAVHRGTVHLIDEAGADHLLIAASDRISAFGVVTAEPIPGRSFADGPGAAE